MIATIVWTLITVSYTFTWQLNDTMQKTVKMYWGTGNGVFENVVDVGNNITTKLTLDIGTRTKVCFAVAAANEMNESKRSIQTCRAVPLTPSNLDVVEQVIVPATLTSSEKSEALPSAKSYPKQSKPHPTPPQAR